MSKHFNPNIPFSKIESLKKKKNVQRLKQLKDDLPVYNSLKEVEMYRLPYNQVLLIKTEEQGYFYAANLVRYLIDFQENIRNEFGKESEMWTKPRLMESKNELNTLCEALCKAEKAHKKRNEAEECDSLISIAVHFSFENPDWIWMGEQLFLHAIDVSRNCETTGGKHEAISRFLYAKFVMETIGANDVVKDHLSKAKVLSHGTLWTIKKFLPSFNTPIYFQITLMCYNIFIGEAKSELKHNPAKAFKLASTARKHAAEACNYAGQIEALSIMSLSALLQNQINEAKETAYQLYRFYAKQETKSTYGDLFQIVIRLIKEEKEEDAYKVLLNVEELLKIEPMPYSIIEIYQLIGDYYLKNDNPTASTPLYAIGFEQYFSNGYFRDAEDVRCFAAISKGQEHMPDFIDLIKSSLKGNRESLKVLLDWKISKIPFWHSKEEARDTDVDREFENLVQSDDKVVEELTEHESPIGKVNSLMKFSEDSSDDKKRSSSKVLFTMENFQENSETDFPN